MLTSVPESELDYAKLNHELDKVKTAAFLSKNAAFFGSILCSLQFIWTRDHKTAATNGTHLFWNPDFFIKSSEKLREAVLIHEINHVARMHMIRRGDRKHRTWVKACDYRINNDMDCELKKNSSAKMYEFEGFTPYMDHLLDRPSIKSEEEIYEELIKNGDDEFDECWGGEGDMLEPEKPEQVINIVVRAVETAKYQNQAGSIPGGVEKLVEQFLAPVVPWEHVLKDFFTEKLFKETSWRKPNRRNQDMYMPSRIPNDGALEHIRYYQDVSGSISEEDNIRFNSELKYIQEELKPKKLVVCQFDTIIQSEREYQIDQPFEKVKRKGFGGTSWECVKQDIEKHNPTCVVIFTDLDFYEKVLPPKTETPVIWIGIHALGVVPPFGTITHIS